MYTLWRLCRLKWRACLSKLKVLSTQDLLETVSIFFFKLVKCKSYQDQNLFLRLVFQYVTIFGNLFLNKRIFVRSNDISDSCSLRNWQK